MERMQEERENRNKHKKDLESRYGTSGNPKADLLYAIAWDYGHSSGFDEVGVYYADMVGLIK